MHSKLSKSFYLLKSIIPMIIIFVAFFSVIIFSQSCKIGCIDGVEKCIFVLLPSLLLFLILSNFSIDYGIFTTLEKLFSKFSWKLFKINSPSFTVLLISLIGGYPVGAVQILSLYKNKSISKLEAQRLSLICVCGGPCFIISVVGMKFFGNITIGLILYISQVITVFLLAFFSKFDKKFIFQKSSTTQLKCKKNISTCLVESVSKSTNSLIGIFVYVIIFSILFQLLEDTNIMAILCNMLSKVGFNILEADCIIRGLFEVTAGTQLSTTCGFNSILITNFIVGFSGISVILQIISIANEIEIPKLKFISYRLFNAIISTVITYFITKIFRPQLSPTQPTMIIETIRPFSFHISYIYITSFLLCIVVFIFSISNNFSFNKKVTK